MYAKLNKLIIICLTISGHYFAVTGDNTVYRSKTSFFTPLIAIQTDGCLAFKYYIGQYSYSLHIYKKDIFGAFSGLTTLQYARQHTNIWQQKYIDLQAGIYQLQFQVRKYSSYSCGVVIDDIEVTQGACNTGKHNTCIPLSRLF